MNTFIKLILLPILMPLLLIIAFLTHYFSFMFSSFGNFIYSTILFPVALFRASFIAIIAVLRIYFDNYYNISETFSEIIDFCGGVREEVKEENIKAEKDAIARKEHSENFCAWCGNRITGQYHTSRFSKTQDRYCSRKCYSEAGY